MSYTYPGGSVTVTSSAGSDVLLLRRLSCREPIGELFEFQLELASPHAEIACADLVGRPLTVALALVSGAVRYISGIVSEFSRGSSDERFTYYRAILVPTLWRLTQCTHSRIFQDRTVPEIILEVLRRRHVLDVELRLRGSYVPRACCTQYRETDYQFICRLMQQEGISFYFTHKEKAHTLVLFDSPGGSARSAQIIAPCAAAPGTQRDRRIWKFGWEHRLAHGAYSLGERARCSDAALCAYPS